MTKAQTPPPSASTTTMKGEQLQTSPSVLPAALSGSLHGSAPGGLPGALAASFPGEQSSTTEQQTTPMGAPPPPQGLPPHHQYPNTHYYTPPIQQQSLPLYAPPYQYYHSHAPFYPPPHTHVYLPWQQQSYQYYPPAAPQTLWPPQHDPGSQPGAPPTSKPGPLQEAPQHHFVPPQPRYAYARQPPASYAYTSSVHPHDDPSIVASPVGGGRVQTSPAKRGGGGGRRRGSAYTNGLSGNGSTSNTPSKSRAGGGGGNTRNGNKTDVAGSGGLDELARELATSARQAVGRADEVTIALLLTSWASMLEDCNKNNTATTGTSDSATQQPPFDAVFRASGALQICSQSLLFMDAAAAPDSAVQKALVSLYGFVLYGTERLHRAVARAARRLSATGTATTHSNAENASDAAVDSLVGDLQKTLAVDSGANGQSTQHTHAKHAAVHSVIDVLRNIADDVSAYNGILPGSCVSPATVNGSTPTPAGPDPTKVIDRAMDAWRRACARLQGQVAIVVVLERAAASITNSLAAPAGSSECVVAFFDEVQRCVLDEIMSDVSARRAALTEKWWPSVADTEARKVVSAVEERAAGFLSVMQRAVCEVDASLSNMGLAFGPPQRVPDDRFQPLMRCSAGVAATIAAHENALNWCEATSRTITGMTVAFRALATTREGRYKPGADAVAQFEKGISAAAAAVRQVQEWEANAVLSKVVACVQKSASPAPTPNDTPKHKGIRFEEPPATTAAAASTDSIAPDDDPAIQKRRKPRHARMKSSPDELLHLNAHQADADEGNTTSNNTATPEVCASEASDCSPVKASPASVVTVLSQESDIKVVAASLGVVDKKPVSGSGELAVVYEEKPLSSGDEDDEEDRHIVVHPERTEDEESPGRKRGKHARSISVDGIPSFGV